jgi:hypothetical protein
MPRLAPDHTVRYFGVLASASKLRQLMVPKPRPGHYVVSGYPE